MLKRVYLLDTMLSLPSVYKEAQGHQIYKYDARNLTGTKRLERLSSQVETRKS